MSRVLGFLFFFFSCFAMATEFKMPRDLAPSDIPTIVQTFSSGFIVRTPPSLLALKKNDTQVGLSSTLIETDKIAELGSGSKDKDVQVQEIFFSKRLPLDVELGFQTSLAFVEKDINKYGGYVRWAMMSSPLGSLVLVGHGSSVNFQNVMGSNLYGGSLNLDFVWNSIEASFGTGFIRTTSTFEASLFAGSPASAPHITYGKQYAHQSVKLSYFWDRIAVSAQGDWIKDFFGSASIGYLF